MQANYRWRILDASVQQPRLESLEFDRIETEEQAFNEAVIAYRGIKETIIGHAQIEIIGVLGRYDPETGRKIYG